MLKARVFSARTYVDDCVCGSAFRSITLSRYPLLNKALPILMGTQVPSQCVKRYVMTNHVFVLNAVDLTNCEQTAHMYLQIKGWTPM